MADPFLSAADEADFSALNQQGLETEMVMAPSRTIMLELERWDPITEDYVVQDPQRVLIEYENRQEDVEANEAGTDVRIDGWFRKNLADGAFNVRPGDTFTFGDEAADQAGSIVSVRVPELGEQRASFTMSVGDTGE